MSSESTDIFFWLLQTAVDEKATMGRVLFKFVLGTMICVVSIFLSIILTPEDDGSSSTADDDASAIPVTTTLEIAIGGFAVSNFIGFLGIGALSYFSHLGEMGQMIPQSELREEVHDIYKSAGFLKALASFSFFYVNILYFELVSTLLILLIVIIKGAELEQRNDAVAYITFALLVVDNLTSWIKIGRHARSYLSFLKSFVLSFSLRGCLGENCSGSAVCCCSTLAFPLTWFVKGIKYTLVWAIGFVLTATVGVFYLVFVFCPLMVLWPCQIVVKLFRRCCKGKGHSSGFRTGIRIFDATLLEDDDEVSDFGSVAESGKADGFGFY